MHWGRGPRTPSRDPLTAAPSTDSTRSQGWACGIFHLCLSASPFASSNPAQPDSGGGLATHPQRAGEEGWGLLVTFCVAAGWVQPHDRPC